MGPCAVCGDEDRSPSGACRPCAARRKAEQRERDRQRLAPVLDDLADLGARMLERRR